ncbi:hypothetical protein ACHQM5_007065 [Ranunculus cassubicifolius]
MEKKQRCSSDEKVDRISTLPEVIRNIIVSYLPMADAITTSVLSKSWRNVCSSLSYLDFDQQLFDEMTGTETVFNFKDSVSQLIDRRDRSNVRAFRLVVDVDDSIKVHIHAWISYMVQHNIKKLYLRARSGKLDSLPCSLFTCGTLTVLCLSNIQLELPAVGKFPLVKLLYLRRVQWSDVSQTNKLISNCPLLKLLGLIHCSWNKSDILVIDTPNLKLLVWVPASYHQEVCISCLDLYEGHYIGYPPDISTETLSSMSLALLDFKPVVVSMESQSVIDQRASKIFMGLHNVIHLELRQFALEILSRNQDLFTKIQIRYCSLKSLELEVYSTENQVQFVASLLSIVPNLQNLIISFNEPGPLASLLNLKGHYRPQTSPVLGALKGIRIKEAEGNVHELYLVRHLLKKAKVLLIMEISYSSFLDLELFEQRRINIGKKIKQFAIASPKAIVSFV